MAEEKAGFTFNSALLTFDNTEIAFRTKSDRELKSLYRLYKLISTNLWTKIGSGITQLALKMGLPITAVVKTTLYKQFYGGESINTCETTIQRLSKGHVGAILNYSATAQLGESAYVDNADEIVRTILKAKNDPRIPFAVFKPSSIARFKLLEKLSAGKTLANAEQVEYFKVKARINHICKTAYDADVPVIIDAEETWIQPAADDLAIAMMRMYNQEKAIVYNTYQLYRKDKFDSLQWEVNLAESEGFFYGAKLVRGAYIDKERNRAARLNIASPIYDTKEDTDKAYNNALQFCIEHSKTVACIAATHNEASCLILTEFMRKHQLPEDHLHVYFAQLLGMSDHISFNLSFLGYNVAKYIAYGPVKTISPYLFQQAEENKAIKYQLKQELGLIGSELKRRGVR